MRHARLHTTDEARRGNPSHAAIARRAQGPGYHPRPSQRLNTDATTPAAEAGPPIAPPRRAASIVVVFLTVFIDLLGFGIIIPLLPVYTRQHGASEFELGLLFAIFSLMQLLFAPFWGRLSDKVGRRPVLITGLLGTAAAYALFAKADTLALIFVSRAAAGFFGATIPTAVAYIADVSPVEHRARAMGVIGAAYGLGFTIGPLAGGQLASTDHPGLPGWAAASLSLTAALFAWIKLVEPARHTRSAVNRAGALRIVAADPRARTLYVLYFFAILGFTAFETMFTRFGLARFPSVFHLSGAVEHASIDELMAAAPVAGNYLCFVGIVSAIVQGGLIRRLVPRFGETRLAVAGPLFLALALLVIGAAPFLPLGEGARWAVVIVGCIVLPFGFGLNNPALSGLMSIATPPEHQGACAGLWQSVAALARVVGPPLAGATFITLGPSSPFFAGALTLLGAGIVAAIYHRRFGASFARRA
jgi:DHA1 family tetracycline resistance protein-like MFS transporter